MIQLKTEAEIAGIRKSCHLLAKMFAHLDTKIGAGLTTHDVDKICADFIKENNATAPCLGFEGYPAATCVSVNDTVIHGIPTNKIVLKDGDLVSVDVCIDLDGYISDSTHTYEIGTVSDKVHQLNEVTRKCLDLGIEAAGKKGARIQDIGEAVFKYASKFGFGVVRDYCGHGVGLSIHEDPEVPNYTSKMMPNPHLREGMVIAIEPMINMGSYKIKTLSDGWTVKTVDGSVACHWEHTIAITKDGLEVLTVL